MSWVKLSNTLSQVQSYNNVWENIADFMPAFAYCTFKLSCFFLHEVSRHSFEKAVLGLINAIKEDYHVLWSLGDHCWSLGSGVLAKGRNKQFWAGYSSQKHCTFSSVLPLEEWNSAVCDLSGFISISGSKLSFLLLFKNFLIFFL